MKFNSIENTPTPFKRPKISSIPKKPKNINQELINEIKNLNEENSKLKEALADLQNDLKEKDESIEECQKIINKLKEEYSKVVKEFELMENSYNELLEDLNHKTLGFSEHKKMNTGIGLNVNSTKNKKFLLKQNDFKEKKILSSEDIRDTNENSNLENKYNISKNLEKKNCNSSNIIKEKDLIIKELNLKLIKLNNAINKKQNKFNDKNNNKKILEKIFEKGITHFSYKDLQKQNFILNNNSKLKIHEEFIITNNLITELIKSELYSGLIREYHFTIFLRKILEKLDLNKLKETYKFIIEHKNNYLKIIQENTLLKKANKILYKNILELKEKIKINNKEVKNKFTNLIENINKNSVIFHKINIYDECAKNKTINKSYKLKGRNKITIDKTKKKVETLKLQTNANTLPLIEKTDIDEIKMSKYNRQSQDLSYTSKIIITNRINE